MPNIAPNKGPLNGSENQRTEHRPKAKPAGGRRPDPLARKIAFTRFPDVFARRKREYLWSLRFLAENVIQRRVAETKAQLPFLKAARFGERRSEKGCYRHNKNVLTCTGIEADFDEHLVKIPFAEAKRRLKQANITALGYTTASHQQPGKGNRWRLICPLAKECRPNEREVYVARLNGLFDGELDPASFQTHLAFYYGTTPDGTPVETFLVAGKRCIDEAIDLDITALGREATQPTRAKAARDEKTNKGNQVKAFNGDLAELRSATMAIANDDVEYDDWLIIGMCLHFETDGSAAGLAIWLEWSQQSTKHEHERAVGTWEHFGFYEGPLLTGLSIAHIARRSGWRPKGRDKLPVIRIVPGEIGRAVDDAEKVLLDSARPIFKRGSDLVEPVIDIVPASNDRKTEVIHMRPFCHHCVIDALSQEAIFQRYDRRSREWLDIDPPELVANILRNREGAWKFPPIAGVITTPTLRQDGTVLSEAGYDSQTRLYHAPDPTLELPPLKRHPTRKDAKEALKLLDDLLIEFPFVDDESRAVALSGLMTPILRGAIATAPMHGFTAPEPGSGKSLLTDTASAIITGKICPVISTGPNIEELEKKLAGEILLGSQIISIDNVDIAIGGAGICQLIERPVVKIRLFGSQQIAECETRATTFINGNNLVLQEDVTRRSLLSRLDAEMERPETRRFKANPFKTVIAHRGKYIAAVLTITRAYLASREKVEMTPLGSFEDWAEMVRAPLIWLGEADPVSTQEELRAKDPELQNIRTLFANWNTHFGLGVSVSASRLIAKACDEDHPIRPLRELLDKIGERGGGISTRSVGHWLTRISGRVVSEFRLSLSDRARDGNLYKLERLEDCESGNRESELAAGKRRSATKS